MAVLDVGKQMGIGSYSVLLAQGSGMRLQTLAAGKQASNHTVRAATHGPVAAFHAVSVAVCSAHAMHKLTAAHRLWS